MAKSTKETINYLKGVTLSFEKFGCLLDLPREEAGEIIQTILTFGMTSKMPEFKDRYKTMYYQTFLTPIADQMTAAAMRAEQCRKAAEDRASALKDARKIINKQEHDSKHTKKYDNVEDSLSSMASVVSTDTLRNGTSSIADTETKEVVPSIEDLSFGRFIACGIKMDTGTFNGEQIWNDMSDDDKRAAISYAIINIRDDVRKANSLYASQFLKSGVWKNG